MTQLVFTVNAAWANRPEWCPSAAIQCVPGVAEEGNRIVVGPKLPVGLAATNISSVVSKYTSTRSDAPKPAPVRVMVEPGAPVAGERARPGVMTKLAVLVAVPPGVVTLIRPVEPAAGTVATILVSVLTLNALVTALNVTDVAPVNPDPLMVTLVPIVPDVGVKEVSAGAAAAAGIAVR